MVTRLITAYQLCDQYSTYIIQINIGLVVYSKFVSPTFDHWTKSHWSKPLCRALADNPVLTVLVTFLMLRARYTDKMNYNVVGMFVFFISINIGIGGGMCTLKDKRAVQLRGAVLGKIVALLVYSVKGCYKMVVTVIHTFLCNLPWLTFLCNLLWRGGSQYVYTSNFFSLFT